MSCSTRDTSNHNAPNRSHKSQEKNGGNSGGNYHGHSGNFGYGNNGRDDEKKDGNHRRSISEEKDTETIKKKPKKQRTEEEKQSGLNTNAATFVPKQSLPTIYEMHKNKKQNKFKKRMQNTYGIIGNIHVSRALTEKIIPEKIRENIQNVYEYMHKTTILNFDNECQTNGQIRIFNYDFTDIKTGKKLYCVAFKQNGANYAWKMAHNLWTDSEMETLYQIKKCLLPKSFRDTLAVQDIKCINNNEFVNIINETKWNKKAVYAIKNKLYNQQRLVLYLTNKQFVQKMLRYIAENANNVCGMIPILILNDDKCFYNIEYVRIVNITSDLEYQTSAMNIGISFKYEESGNRMVPTVTGIYLDKFEILSLHQLAVPHCHSCQCLEGFKCGISLLKIGNPDEDKNKVKDLRNKLQNAKKQICAMKNDMENDKHLRVPSLKPIMSNSFGMIQSRQLMYTPSSSLTPNMANVSYSNPATPNVMTPLPITPLNVRTPIQTGFNTINTCMAFPNTYSNQSESKDNKD